MNERIKIILKKYSLSASRFAEMLGVQASGVSHILSGRNKPGYEFIVKVLETFPDINPDWFLLGKGAITRYGSGLPSYNNLVEENAVIEQPTEVTFVCAEENNASEVSINAETNGSNSKGEPILEFNSGSGARAKQEEAVRSSSSEIPYVRGEFNDGIVRTGKTENDKDCKILSESGEHIVYDNIKRVEKIIILNDDKTFSIYNQEC